MRERGELSPSGNYGPEIGDMDEGVVEGSEYAGDAEDEFTLGFVSCCVQMVDFEGKSLPSLTCGPREMFSCAGRTAFLGGMVGAGCKLCVLNRGVFER